jgi:23S rRNA G2069 N7-methylase RlmK/C1962 C5-methylase RlmI
MQLASHARNVAKNNIVDVVYGLKADLDTFGNSIVERIDKFHTFTESAIAQWRDEANAKADSFDELFDGVPPDQIDERLQQIATVDLL